MKTAGVDAGRIENGFAALEREAKTDLAREGFAQKRRKLARSVAMRYIGQSFEITVPWARDFEGSFHAAHRERYGYADTTRPTEIVSLKVKATGITEKPRLARYPSIKDREVAPHYTARVFLTERPRTVPVFLREQLGAGARFRGPAIVVEYSSTTLIPSERSVEIDPWLSMIIS
ncbi:MAG TPA: hypothetical protein VFQ92_05580 [Blastocatellia bacterium]|nr:hypothetical protein [Blastocatellia bacterium]